MDELNTVAPEVVESQEAATTTPEPKQEGINVTINTNAYNSGSEPKKSSGLAVASLVLGIVALVFCFISFISIPSAIVALVLGIISIVTKKGGKGMAITGVILSAIGLVVAIIIVVIAAAALAAIGTELNNLQY